MQSKNDHNPRRALLAPVPRGNIYSRKLQSFSSDSNGALAVFWFTSTTVLL